MSDIAASKARLLARIALMSTRGASIPTGAGRPDATAVGADTDPMGRTVDIGRIDAALDLIDRGLYGICGSCNLPINESRLDDMPWTLICDNCAPQAGAVTARRTL